MEVKTLIQTIQMAEDAAWFELAYYQYQNAPRTPNVDDWREWEMNDVGYNIHEAKWAALHDLMSELEIDDYTGTDSLRHEALEFSCKLYRERLEAAKHDR